MKTPSNELYELINSLSKTEKSYFKKFSVKNLDREKNYLDLFDSYSKHTSLKKGDGIKYISRAKNYLHDVILKALRNYHTDSYIQSRISEHIHNAEILHEKLLFKQALKEIIKAKILASEFEMLNTLLDVLWWERHVTMRIEERPQKIKEDMKRITQETDKTLLFINNINDYRKVADRIHVFINYTGFPRKKNDLNTINQFLSLAFLKNENLAISYWSKLYFYQIHCLLAITVHDYKKSYESAIQMLKLMESKPKLANEHMYGLLNSYNYVLAACVKTNQHSSFEFHLKKLRELPSIYENAKHLRSEISIFENGYNSEINYALETCNFTFAIKIADKVIKGLEKFDSKIQTKGRLQMYLNISKTYFYSGNYKLALHWLNKVLQKDEQNLKDNLFVFAKIFNLIIHFELKNNDLLHYVVKSTLRSMEKSKRLYKVESEIISFINKHSESDSDQKLIHSFTDLKNKLILLETDQFEKTAFLEFNYLNWIESKIQKRKIAEIASERMLLQNKK